MFKALSYRIVSCSTVIEQQAGCGLQPQPELMQQTVKRKKLTDERYCCVMFCSTQLTNFIFDVNPREALNELCHLLPNLGFL